MSKAKSKKEEEKHKFALLKTRKADLLCSCLLYKLNGGVSYGLCTSVPVVSWSHFGGFDQLPSLH